MVITFVLDMFGSSNNGTTVTCMRTARILRERGNEVRIIAYIPKDHEDLSMYKVLPCDRFVVPFFDKLILDKSFFSSLFRVVGKTGPYGHAFGCSFVSLLSFNAKYVPYAIYNSF